MSEKEKEHVNKIYNKNGKLSKEGLVDEYIRMIIQDRLTGKTSENFVLQPKSEALKFIQKLFNYLRKMFLNKSINSATSKNVDKIINYINNSDTIVSAENLPYINICKWVVI